MQRSDLDRPPTMSLDNVAFVAFSSDLVSYGLMEVLQVQWMSTHKSSRKTFNELVGAAAVVFRHRHADELTENIADCPYYVLDDLENAVEYLQCFVRSNFQGVALLMEVIVFFAFLLDLSICCYENEKIEFIPEIVEETYDVYEEYIKPYFRVVGGWHALGNMAEQYLEFVKAMNEYGVLVCTETDDTEDNVCVVNERTDCPSTISVVGKVNVGSVRGDLSEVESVLKDCLGNVDSVRGESRADSDKKDSVGDVESVPDGNPCSGDSVRDGSHKKFASDRKDCTGKVDCIRQDNHGNAASIRNYHPSRVDSVLEDCAGKIDSVRKDCPVNDSSAPKYNKCSVNLKNVFMVDSVKKNDYFSNTSSPDDSPMDITYYSNDLQVTNTDYRNEFQNFSDQGNGSSSTNAKYCTSRNNIQKTVTAFFKNYFPTASVCDIDVKMDVSVDGSQSSTSGKDLHKVRDNSNFQTSFKALGKNLLNIANTRREDFQKTVGAHENSFDTDFKMDVSEWDMNGTTLGSKTKSSISPAFGDCCASIKADAHENANANGNSPSCLFDNDASVCAEDCQPSENVENCQRGFATAASGDKYKTEKRQSK